MHEFVIILKKIYWRFVAKFCLWWYDDFSTHFRWTYFQRFSQFLQERQLQQRFVCASLTYYLSLFPSDIFLYHLKKRSQNEIFLLLAQNFMDLSWLTSLHFRLFIGEYWYKNVFYLSSLFYWPISFTEHITEFSQRGLGCHVSSWNDSNV